MSRLLRFASFSIAFVTFLVTVPSVRAQLAPGLPARAVVTQNIDEAQRVRVRGNTRSEARAANDRGAIADDFPIEHMLLQLQRPPEQERALQQFIDELHTQGSPNFHRWITPQEFGQRFGLAKQDLDTITSWLESQGFTVNAVYPSGMVIDFSGTAGLVRRAFRTEIHNLEVKGEKHIANMSDPQIPAALAPAVAGIVSLHDFRPRALHVMRKARPDYTFSNSSGSSFVVVPSDLATIYNLNPLFNAGYSGQGQTIAVIEDTDAFSSSDWTTFRSTLGLSGYTSGSFTTIHPVPLSGTNNCTPPGVVALNDAEAILDGEWASAAAPSATIEIASCADTTTTFGGLIAIQNLLNASQPPAIISLSYTECETLNGASANAAYNSAYQQAVAQGISVFVATGDGGAASCDDGAAAATDGIGVNAFASTPYNVAVGGTDFSDTSSNSNNIYWNSTNTSTYGSALSYIPEIPWNDSCAGTVLSNYEGDSIPYGTAGFCNSTGGQTFLDVGAGGGGPSGCATGTPSSGGVVSGSCQGWPKPSWQSVLGNPSDGARDLPDISLFASDGLWNHYYVVCWSDTTNGGAPCTGAPSTWSGAGGTSFGAPIMAGIQALVNQKTGGPQGNPNPVYYQLAASEYGSSGTSCYSSNGNGVSSACIFYDVTQGDIDVNCTGSNNCYLPAGTNGVLSTANNSYQPAYSATTGWDFATGIGSVNAANLVNSWPTSIPAVPTGLSATPGNAQVNLTWSASSSATTYNVYSSTTNGGPYSKVINVTTTSYTNTGLTNGTTYYYVVTAVNGLGESGNSSQTSAMPVAPPSAPTGLSATPGNAQVSLTWNASSGATTYNVFSSTTNGGPYGKITNVATTSYTNTGLTNGTTYYYVVTAVNAGGESGNSNQVSAMPSAALWPNGYSFRRAITIDHTKVPSTDQSNFPVLFSGTYSYLATTSNGGGVTNANGYDILFTSDASGTIPLAYERESYGASNGAVNFWVGVPSVSHSSDTVVYMFYGNSSVGSDQSNGTGTWDSNYKGVWHFPDGTTLTLNDSTSNGNNGTASGGVTAAAGQIGGGASVNGTGQDVDFGTANSLNVSSGATWSCWFKTNGTAGGGAAYHPLMSRLDSMTRGYQLYILSSGVFGLVTDAATLQNSSFTLSDNNWHLYEVTDDGSGHIKFYVDGSPQGTGAISAFNVTSATTHNFGAFSPYAYANGVLDEMRISAAARSADWITTEYNNQSSPATFYGVGAASIGGGSPAPSITSLSPTSGPVGTSVTITGANFGSTQGTVTFNGTPATTFSGWSATSIGVMVPTGATTGNVVVTAAGQASNGMSFTVGWPNGYSYRRTITIDHTKVPSTDQSNFPVLFSGTYSYLATTSNGGGVTSANGYDILFTSDASGSSALASERETYNASSGAVNFWVRVPSVSHSSDTVVYMFYGNSSVSSDQSNGTGTWDSNYKGVWHFPDGTTLTLNDSTSNGNNGTASGGVTAAAGQIGGGASVNGTGQDVDFGTANSLNVSSGATWSCWFKTNGTAGGGAAYHPLMSRLDSMTRGYQLYILSSGVFGLVTDAATLQNSSFTLSDNNWHLYEVTDDGSGHIKFYVDGSPQGTGAISAFNVTSATTHNFGAFSPYAYANGVLDEMRISAAARSADWITTEYNNQSSPATFYGVGAASIGGGSPAPSITSLSPTSGPVGTSVTITGANFGSTQGTVTFNGTPATTFSGWSATSIGVMVPTGATTGNVVVTAAGQASNPITFTVTGSFGGWPNGYSYRRMITIDHTKVPNTDQSNFPVLFSGTYSYLATTSNGGGVTNANGYDILFTSDASGTIPLAYERESYGASNGAVNFWVGVPSVSHSSDTVVYMFYGNSSVGSDQSNGTGTWDSNYKGVWHFPDGTTLTLNDSTSNGNNGTASGGVTAAAGQIGGGASVNGTGQDVDFGTANSLNVSSGATWSCWFKTNGTAGGGAAYHPLMSRLDSMTRGYQLYILSSGVFGLVTDAATLQNSSFTLSDNNWHLYEVTDDGSGHIKFYVDGSPQGTGAISAFNVTSATTHNFGAFSPYAYANGVLDEMRISAAARSADWITTEYNNQNSPATFYNVGVAQ